jgi:NAD(P)-dependent dehydrogenase (short-subunit alcohol dehydrogenase family)
MSMSTANELAGKVALITGAAKNLGRAIALELAAAGATVAINTRASRAEADTVAAEISAAGGKAAVYMADIADASAVQRMHAAVSSELGPVDILVLNASVRREIPFMKMSFEEWRQVMGISLDGSFHCIQAVLPGMLKAGRGDVITLGGDTALNGAVGKVHSSAGVWPAGHPFQLRIAGTLQYRTRRQPCRTSRRNRAYSAEPLRRTERDCRNGPVSVQPRRRLHHRTDAARQWWPVDVLAASWIKQLQRHRKIIQ